MKVDNAFYMPLQDYDTTRKKRVKELNNDLLGPKTEFKVGDNKKYEFETIIDNAVYSQETNDQMLGSPTSFCRKTI